ncbi:MAG TPA: membrane protein insertase YidC, partial [Methylocella sp.]|nr:membrane protein insertase YidC [Methylocella sp.]
MTQETKNVVLATILSLLFVLAWDRFYIEPQLEKQRQTQAQMQAREPSSPQTARPQAESPPAASQPAAAPPAQSTAAPLPSELPAQNVTRAVLLAETPRVKIDAPAVYGSISLKGGRIDDVSFKAYRETVDPHSPN